MRFPCLHLVEAGVNTFKAWGSGKPELGPRIKLASGAAPWGAGKALKRQADRSDSAQQLPGSDSHAVSGSSIQESEHLRTLTVDGTKS